MKIIIPLLSNLFYPPAGFLSDRRLVYLRDSIPGIVRQVDLNKLTQEKMS